jgi:hypothetical protein
MRRGLEEIRIKAYKTCFQVSGLDTEMMKSCCCSAYLSDTVSESQRSGSLGNMHSSNRRRSSRCPIRLIHTKLGNTVDLFRIADTCTAHEKDKGSMFVLIYFSKPSYQVFK